MSLKISVIIPVYNASTFLESCIESVRNQKYSNFEIILVNDGSTDNSASICEMLALKDTRIRVIHQENLGVSRARNEGLKKSQGEWIYFVDADDNIVPGAFDVFFKENEIANLDIIRFGLNRIYLNGNVITDKPENEEYFKNIDSFYLKSNFNIFTLCVNFLRKSIITEYSLKFSENIMYAEDLEFTSKYYMLSNNILTLNIALYNYNIHEDSAMAKDTTFSSIIDHSIVLENMVEFINLNNTNINSRLFMKARLIYFMKSFLSRISLQKKWFYYINLYQKEYRNMYVKSESVLGSQLYTPFFLINKISIIFFVLYVKLLHLLKHLLSKVKK